MKTPNANNLSAYTIAANCSDFSDVQAGIQEIKEYFAACEKAGVAAAKTAYARFAKLNSKQDKLQSK